MVEAAKTSKVTLAVNQHPAEYIVLTIKPGGDSIIL